MKKATQQRILKALNRTLVDLSTWLRERGLSEAEAVAILSAVMRENGIMAGVVRNLSTSMTPITGQVSAGAEQADDVLAWARSGEYAEWLLSQPEPTPNELDLVLLCYRSILPNVRQYFQDATKPGPRYRGGGRPTAIDDPKEREKVRTAIQALRKPGTNLEVIYKRLGDKYGVSPTTIKRIRLEKT